MTIKQPPALHSKITDNNNHTLYLAMLSLLFHMPKFEIISCSKPLVFMIKISRTNGRCTCIPKFLLQDITKVENNSCKNFLEIG